MNILEKTHPIAQRDAINRAMKFEMGRIVERYVRDEGLTETIAREHEQELKRFLAMCALNPNAQYGMKGPIDELWHTFLIFSKDYAQFCDHVAGRFIHHVPESGDEKPRNSDTYALFLRDYEETFGHPPPAQYWPRPISPDVTAECQGCNTCSVGEGAPADPKITIPEAHCSECNGCGDSVA